MASHDEDEEIKFCYGVLESQIMPMLLSSLTTTEICLMFLIQKSGKDVYFKSRNCVMEIDGNGNCCQKCVDLLDNLTHFHHLYLKQSCSQYTDSNSKEMHQMNAYGRKLKMEPKNELNSENIKSIEYDDVESPTCTPCGEICPSIEEFSKHRSQCRKYGKTLKIVKTKNNYTCDTCGEVFNSSKLYDRHLKCTHCEVCGEATMSLEWHIKKKHTEMKPKEKCPFCEEMFLTHGLLNKLQSHVLKFHYEKRENSDYISIMKREVKEFKCNEFECEEIFKTYSSLITHKSRSHGKFSCEYCGKNFYEGRILTNHISLNHKPCNKICCEQTFVDKKQYISHRNTVHRKKDQCPECKKPVVGGNMKRHFKEAHLKVKDFICNICGMAFSLAARLRKHIRVTHERIRPYSCELCAYRASSITNLNYHRSKMHQLNRISKEELKNLIKEGLHPNSGNDDLNLILMGDY